MKMTGQLEEPRYFVEIGRPKRFRRRCEATIFRFMPGLDHAVLRGLLPGRTHRQRDVRGQAESAGMVVSPGMDVSGILRRDR